MILNLIIEEKCADYLTITWEGGPYENPIIITHKQFYGKYNIQYPLDDHWWLGKQRYSSLEGIEADLYKGISLAKIEDEMSLFVWEIERWTKEQGNFYRAKELEWIEKPKETSRITIRKGVNGYRLERLNKNSETVEVIERKTMQEIAEVF